MSAPTSIAIVGRGRVGKGLAKAWRKTSTNVHLVSGRNPRGIAKADTVVLTVPDAAIETVAAELAPRLSAGAVVLHCAGSRGPEVFSSLCETHELHFGAMHPLVSFVGPPPEIAGTTFLIDGDRPAIARARWLARACHAVPIVAPLHGPSYHAAAALLANGSAALAYVSVELLTYLGFGRKDATKAMGTLLRSVAENVERIGVPGALSGPIRRGETRAVRIHQRSLKTLPPLYRETYNRLVPIIVDCAEAIGELDSRTMRALRRLPRR